MTDRNAQPERSASRAAGALVAAALLAVSMPGPPAHAQEAWYTVELLVFERADDAYLNAEAWAVEPGFPPIDRSVRLSAPDELSIAGEGLGDAGASLPIAFRLLPDSALRMRDERSRLARSGAYRPLLHVAWHQPGFSRNDARWAHLHTEQPVQAPYSAVLGIGQAPAAPRPAIDGVARLSRARFLHLDVDLLYRRHGAGPDALFRVKSNRRMRSGERHYLDHPLLGVIALVTPYAPRAAQ